MTVEGSKDGITLEPSHEWNDSVSDLLVDTESDLQPTLSVVIPTLNEEEGITDCIRQVKRAIEHLGVPTEIIVSDSSTDRTPEIALEMGAIVLKPTEPGYGSAYKYGFEHARGEYVAIGDADTTYDFEDLPRLLDHLVTTDADMVLGSRLKGEIEPGAMPPLHRYVGNPILTKFLNLFYDAGVSDAHSGFRVIRREALEQLDLQTTGMEFASEMVIEAAEHGLAIEEVPITYYKRKGDATLHSFHDGWRHVKFMLVNAPTYLFFLPAIIASVIGISMLSVSLFGISVGVVTFGVQTAIAGSLLTIVGYQIGVLGVFSAIAGDPIRAPRDSITKWIQRQLRIEQGILTGSVLFSIGGIYVAIMTGRWVLSGYSLLPLLVANMWAFTAIVIGLQTVFFSFFLSIINER